MASEAQHIRPVLARPAGGRAAVQLAWLVGGLALSFAIPFFGSDVLGLPLTLYYLLYVALVLAFLGTYVGAQPLRGR
jgi:hypothetical protein